MTFPLLAYYRMHILRIVEVSLLTIPLLPISTLFPTRRSSDLRIGHLEDLIQQALQVAGEPPRARAQRRQDRKSTRLNSSHLGISYAVFCLKKKNKAFDM